MTNKSAYICNAVDEFPFASLGCFLPVFFYEYDFWECQRYLVFYIILGGFECGLSFFLICNLLWTWISFYSYFVFYGGQEASHFSVGSLY